MLPVYKMHNVSLPFISEYNQTHQHIGLVIIVKKLILTSKGHAEHLFAGRNTQHTFHLYLIYKFQLCSRVKFKIVEEPVRRNDIH